MDGGVGSGLRKGSFRSLGLGMEDLFSREGFEALGFWEVIFSTYSYTLISAQ